MNGFDMAKLTGQFKEIQGALTKIRVEGGSNSGGIKFILNGQQDVLAVRIHPQLLSPASKSKLENELLMVFNHTIKKSKEKATAEINNIFGIDLNQFNQFF